MMSVAQELRRIDYYDFYSAKIDELDRAIRQQAKKGHGHRKLRDQTHRLYRNGTTRPTGVHDYHNLQWDPSIFRGRTFRDFREKNLPPNAPILDFNKYCCIGCNTPKGVPLNRRKTVVGIPRYKVGGVFRPTTNDIIFEESSGRKRHKQDESRKEMEPFIIEQLEPPEYAERGSQSDEIKEAPKKKCHHIAIGTSIGSQADICIIGTGSHEDPIVPILSNIGSKVVEQSLLETFEEYELHAIRSEIRSYMDQRRNRQARDTRRVVNELTKAEMVELEKTRREHQLQKELQATDMIGAVSYSINICNAVMAQTFNFLRQQKFLAGDLHDAETFKPWMHQQMYRHLQVPQMIVNDIIQHVEYNRVTEFNLATLLSTMESSAPEEVVETSEVELEEEEEEEDELSSVGAPPNTASSLPYTTSEAEEESTGA